MMKHSNVLAEIAAAKGYMTKVCKYNTGPGDAFLSYLPLAHIFDRSVCSSKPLAFTVRSTADEWNML